MTRLWKTVGIAAMILSVTVLAACDDEVEDVVSAASPTPEEIWPPPVPPTPAESPDDEYDVEALADAAGCELTLTHQRSEPWMTEFSPSWIESGEHFIAPDNPGTGEWHTGAATVIIHADSFEQLGDERMVNGRHLDSGEEIVPVEQSHRFETPDGVMAMFWIDIPEDGCWELAVGGQQIVVYLLPEAAHPDVIDRQEQRAAMIPYSDPEDCETSAWVGPTVRHGPLPVGYWLPDADIQVYSTHALFYTVQTEFFIATSDDSATIEGRNISNEAMTARSDMSLASGGPSPLMSGEVTFPVSGCWDLTIEADGQSANAVVYVYPDECRRAPDEDLSPDCLLPD